MRNLVLILFIAVCTHMLVRTAATGTTTATAGVEDASSQCQQHDRQPIFEGAVFLDTDGGNFPEMTATRVCQIMGYGGKAKDQGGSAFGYIATYVLPT